MKYTEYNLLNLLRIIKAAGDRISILTGSDAMAFTSLEFGGNGGVIGVANVAPRLASSLFDEFKSGDLEAARQAQMRLLPAIEAIGIGRFPAGLKEAMRLIGMPVGSVKKPLQSLTIGGKEHVAGFLREAGMLKLGMGDTMARAKPAQVPGNRYQMFINGDGVAGEAEKKNNT